MKTRICPKCVSHLDTSIRTDGALDKVPEEGDWGLCGDCSAILILENGIFRQATLDDFRDLDANHPGALSSLMSVRAQVRQEILEKGSRRQNISPSRN